MRWEAWSASRRAGLSGAALQGPASALEVALGWPEHVPAWYALLRGLVAVVQVTIAVWMLRMVREKGVWGTGTARVSPPRERH